MGSVDKVSEQDRGLDAVRVCHLYDGVNLTEKITAWNQDAREYTLKLVEGKLPIKSLDATFKVTDAGMGKAKLVAEMDLVGKYGFIGKILDVLVFKPKLERGIGNFFAGVEHYGKTGEEVSKGYSAPNPSLVK